MNKNLARLLVIAKALPTRLTLIAAAITVAATQLALVLPEHAAGITRWSVTIVGSIGAAIVGIRKLTPVDNPDQEGILPQGPPASAEVHIDQTPPVDTD